MNGTVKKKRIRLNIIDIILLLIIFIAAALLVYIFVSGSIDSVSGDKETKIAYTVLLTGIREEFRGKINIGDSVTDTVKLMPIGTVSNVRYEDYYSAQEDKTTGNIKYSRFPGFINITIEVSADASLKDGFYMIGGYGISVGTLVSLRVPAFTSQGYCTTLTEAKA